MPEVIITADRQIVKAQLVKDRGHLTIKKSMLLNQINEITAEIKNIDGQLENLK